jgi:branched-chain amino acid transport system substrate-binding protein
MKKRKVVVLMAVAFAIALGMASSAQTPGVTDTTINLGAFIAQSGALATIGIPVAHGAQAWYNYVNDEWGGIYGRKINFIPYDDVFNPANTVAGVKKLVEEDGIFALVNSLGTTGFQAVRDYLVANAVPVVTPHANWITLASPVTPGWFAIQPNNEAFGRTLTQYAVLRLGGQKIGLAVVDDAMGNELKSFALDELARLGLSPVITVQYPGTETNFSSYALQLRQAGADVVLLFSYLRDAAGILNEANTLGYAPKWVGINTITLSLYQLAPDAAEGIYFPGFATDPSLPYNIEAQQLRAIYNRYFPGEAVTGYAEIAFIGAQMVTDALVQAGQDLTREGFNAALETFTDWEHGLTPKISYSPTDHAGIEALWVNQLVGGTAVFLEEWDPRDH